MPTRRTFVAGLTGLPLLALGTNYVGILQAHAEEMSMADTIMTSAGDLVIHPVDHASLVLQWGGKVIYVDPVGGAERYAQLPEATSILITHGHGDHFDVPTLEALNSAAPLLTNQDVFDKLPEGLKARAKAISNGESGELDGVELRAVAAHNTSADRMKYHPIGVGNGYVLTFGDKHVYIAGDTEPTEDMLGLEGIDVAFLPMNLPYTMTPDQAVEAINTFKPGIIYPYHYGESDLSVLEGALADGVELRLRNWYPNR